MIEEHARIWSQFSDVHDSERAKRALSGILTPIFLDSEAGTAQFAGSQKGPYETSLSECTCPDFTRNLGQSAPCKHMYRLAMELGLYPSDGMVSDINTAFEKTARNLLMHRVKHDPLPSIFPFIQVVSALNSKQSVRVNTNEFRSKYTGVETIATLLADEVKPIRAASKTYAMIIETFTNRIGTLVKKRLSNDALLDLLTALENLHPVRTLPSIDSPPPKPEPVVDHTPDEQSQSAPPPTRTTADATAPSPKPKPTADHTPDKKSQSAQLSFPAVPSIADLFAILKRENIRYVDKTPAGGSIWVFDSMNARRVMPFITVPGANMGFSRKGSKATNYKPAWFIRIKIE